jgi:hypothetical protein
MGNRFADCPTDYFRRRLERQRRRVNCSLTFRALQHSRLERLFYVQKMKKLLTLLAAGLFSLSAIGQTYPSPTFNSITLQTPLAQSSGGTGASTSTGTGSLVLSNSPILVTPNLGTPSAVTLTNGVGLPVSTGLSGLGTGVAASLTTAVTGSGGSVLATSPTIAGPTVTGSLTATGLVTTADLATQAANTVLANASGSTASPTAFVMPACNTTSSALNWTAGTGFTCNASVVQSASSFSSSMTTFFNALPTTLPASSGVLWNNGGILSKS